MARPASRTSPMCANCCERTADQHGSAAVPLPQFWQRRDGTALSTGCAQVRGVIVCLFSFHHEAESLLTTLTSTVKNVLVTQRDGIKLVSSSSITEMDVRTVSTTHEHRHNYSRGTVLPRFFSIQPPMIVVSHTVGEKMLTALFWNIASRKAENYSG